ncbi:MAG: 50S ribosomal protein L11 methyltransferase [Gammaproteobacteria bacterium]|nr:50S ribosomal protein L11 methyltransferase [Gammaproteobacteria bacterium]
MEPYKESNHPALYYQDMLSDERRMARFRMAIDAVVRSGDVVVDLGTGLGVLAIMAARAGAEHVYAVDVRPQIMPIAERIVAANGLSERITLICSDAMDVELPQQVDLIVNELIGDFGTDENIYECVRTVADRYLKDGGRVMPQRLSTHIVGVTYDGEVRGVFGGDVHDMDLSSALTDAFTPAAIMHGLQRQPTELTEVSVVERIEFGTGMPERAYEYSLALPVVRSGDLQGFVGFFDCELAPEISLDNYPCYPGCHWVNWNWPVTPVVRVEKGQKINGMLITPKMTVASCWSWEWMVG